MVGCASDADGAWPSGTNTVRSATDDSGTNGGVIQLDSGGNGLEMTGELDPSKLHPHGDSSLDFVVRWGASENLHSTLHIPAAPELPVGLSPGQAAQLSELLEYLHLQSRTLVQSITLPEGKKDVLIDIQQWQELLDLQAQLAEYLRKIGEPESL